ncbi:MAG: iron ABC transporter permease [Bacilli bacterium]|nr:iron ABC transporter permease [Bacilli bacterium]
MSGTQTKERTPFQKAIKRGANGVITFFGVPANTILVFFGVVLLLLNAFPIIQLLIKSLTGYAYVGEGEWNNFANFVKVFDWTNETSIGNFWKPFGRSLLVSSLACLFSIILGGGTAFLIARTNMKLKKVISVLFIFPYIMPQWTLALFWKNMFISTACSAGHVGEFQALTGIAMPEWWVYGAFPIALMLGLHYAPFAYILFGGVLQNMDSNLEEAATILGIPKIKSFFKVTIPLLKPALFSTILLVFSSAMSSYSVASELGNPVNYFVFATKMQSLLSGSGGRNAGQGYVMAIVLILIGVIMLVMNQIQTGSRKQFTTVTGKSGQISKGNLGSVGKWVVGVVVLILVLFFAVGPMVSFFLESLLPNSGDFSSGLTFKAWISKTPISTNDFVGFFFEPKLRGALWGSVKISLLCSLCAGLFGLLIGYAVAKKRKSKAAGFVNGLAFFPYLMPSLALSLCFYLMGLKLGWVTGAAVVILAVIVGTIKYIPMASRSSLNAMLQLSNEIEEAGVIMNVPWWKRMLRIVFPIQKAAFISGFLLPFISCMREYDLFVFIGNDQLTLTKFMFQLEADGCPALENAANFALIVIILVVNWIVTLTTGASIDKGVGGK